MSIDTGTGTCTRKRFCTNTGIGTSFGIRTGNGSSARIGTYICILHILVFVLVLVM
jgi:hypothetical protein